MSGKSKNSLGTVVECIENTDEAKALLSSPERNSNSKGDQSEGSTGKSIKPAKDRDSRLAFLFGFGSERRRKKRNNSSQGHETLLFSAEDRMDVGDAEQAGTSVAESQHYRNLSGSSSGIIEASSDSHTQRLNTHGIMRMHERKDCGAQSMPAIGDALTSADAAKSSRFAARSRSSESSTSSKYMHECPLCFIRQPEENFPPLSCCDHRSCKTCLYQYLKVEIMESRVQITCPECYELLHPSDIHALVADDPELIDKYEDFSLRRALMTDPDTRWCPAPDCPYAVIATGCAACPELHCERDGCGMYFCYHCKGAWHASQTCDEARRERGGHLRSSVQQAEAPFKPGEIKGCPRCHALIAKMNDGSCNHMVCTMCRAEFCWLCLREINDLHYLSPTGCTFWGKKPWTRKKKLLWQVGTLIGAPVGIALIAGLAIPGIIFGVPVFVGRKINQHFKSQTKVRRRLLTASSVVGSLIVSPVLAVMAVGVGIPIMLAYVYGVVPLSLCRNGGCGLGSSDTASVREKALDDEGIWSKLLDGAPERSLLLNDVERQDGTSVMTGISVNSGLSSSHGTHTRLQVHAECSRRRPSVESGITSLGEKCNYEEASTKAMIGSQYNDDKSVYTVGSGQEAVSYCEDLASTAALAGSVVDAKSLTDSASGRVVVASTYNRERDLSPTTQQTKTVIVHGEERQMIVPTYQYHPEVHPSYSRDDTTSCSSLKRRGRATSTASSGSTRFPHCSSQSPHSNSQQCVNVVVASSLDEDEEIILMSEDVALQLAAENGVPFPAKAETKSLLSDNQTNSQPGAPTVVWAIQAESDQQQRADRFRIRALFDTMKQIVSDDVAADDADDMSRPNTSGFWIAARRSSSGGVVLKTPESSTLPKASMHRTVALNATGNSEQPGRVSKPSNDAYSANSNQTAPEIGVKKKRRFFPFLKRDRK